MSSATDRPQPLRIDGNALASQMRDRLAQQVAELVAEHGVVPGLAVVLVGEDPASRIYVGRKVKFSKEIGMASFEHRLGDDISEEELLNIVTALNEDRAIHGILVQLPLPAHIETTKILNAIDPAKDVDGFHPLNVGRLSTGTGGMVPCTAMGCLLLIEQVVPNLSGLNACVVGRSNIVGKPVAHLLLQRGCTVTIAHSKTQDLPSIVRAADIVVAAVGQAGLIRGDWVKPGAVIIDVGINANLTGAGVPRLVGDVAFDEMQHAAAVTPVPGGVGPMTITCLLSNTLLAARASI